MAKKVVASTQQKGAKNFTRCIKMVKSPKTGAYTFKEEIVANEDVNAFFKK